MANKKRFVILSGPSCVGKGSLQAAIEKTHPSLLKNRLVLWNTRKKRSHEKTGVDYHFKTLDEFNKKRASSTFITLEVRDDWQGIDLEDLMNLFNKGDLVFAEVFYEFSQKLADDTIWNNLKLDYPVNPIRIFLHPVPFNVPVNFTIKTMWDKLKRRGTDTPKKARSRAESAPIEMTFASQYTHRLLNPAGEDDTEEWGCCGIRGNWQGERAVESIDDLGKNAQWLVEKFIEIVEGKLEPGDYYRKMD